LQLKTAKNPSSVVKTAMEVMMLEHIEQKINQLRWLKTKKNPSIVVITAIEVICNH
jgi:hypothetical protein